MNERPGRVRTSTRERREPPVLGYATPAPLAQAFARANVAWRVIVALAVPGLASWLDRSRAGTFATLTGGVVAAALFFGPLCCEVPFVRSGTLRDARLWPFLASRAAALAVSVVTGLADLQRAVGHWGERIA